MATASPAPDGTRTRAADDIVGVLRLSARFRAHFAELVAAHPLLGPAGLRPPTFAVLRGIDMSRAPSQRELADHIGLHPSDMVALLDDLEGRAWVVRSRDPEDRRRHALALTDGGREALEVLEELAAEAGDRVLAPLGRADRAAFRSLVGQVVSAERG
ncbi:MarR family transcriptional regulator [Iamia majanohamensis]|uniref:MarR family transcriptional regulator n=1 Tax=Iamia majanohamensis TaxID=467976 RepID=A0AAE9YCK9_9ACTN|nr:MarR family transcriptional regulator [Iamia majanohamensis]WCO68733.1 MarR family transcriptional regulator [Iamia majanohamensis]